MSHVDPAAAAGAPPVVHPPGFPARRRTNWVFLGLMYGFFYMSRYNLAAIQAAMREAIAAPLEVMRTAAAAAEQGVVIAALGNPSASSDAQVGFELLGAGLRGAKRNVEINLGSVKDAEYAAKTRGEIEELERAIGHETGAARRTLTS